MEYANGRAKMPPKIYLDLPEHNGDFRAMPAYLSNYAGLKWVNVHPKNVNREIPTVMATIILSNPDTGEPLAYIDGTDITNYRTGAASAVASKYLAREDAESLGLIGLGKQARTQLICISHIFDLQEVRIFDIDEKAIAKFQDDFPNFNLKRCPLREAVDADIISTTTPVRDPIIRSEWIKKGVHINAVGADAQGKEELDPALLQQKGVKIIVDDIRQAQHSGEINIPLARGLINKEDIYGTLPEIVSGKKRGREGEEEITIFDSTGLAIQDLASAKVIYEKALQEDIGTWL